MKAIYVSCLMALFAGGCTKSFFNKYQDSVVADYSISLITTNSEGQPVQTIANAYDLKLEEQPAYLYDSEGKPAIQLGLPTLLNTQGLSLMASIRFLHTNKPGNFKPSYQFPQDNQLVEITMMVHNGTEWVALEKPHSGKLHLQFNEITLSWQGSIEDLRYSAGKDMAASLWEASFRHVAEVKD